MYLSCVCGYTQQCRSLVINLQHLMLCFNWVMRESYVLDESSTIWILRSSLYQHLMSGMLPGAVTQRVRGTTESGQRQVVSRLLSATPRWSTTELRRMCSSREWPVRYRRMLFKRRSVRMLFIRWSVRASFTHQQSASSPYQSQRSDGHSSVWFRPL